MRPRRTAAEDDFAIQCLGHDIAYYQFDYIISPSHRTSVFFIPKIRNRRTIWQRTRIPPLSRVIKNTIISGSPEPSATSGKTVKRSRSKNNL